MACGILVPQPGIEPALLAFKAQSLNHWTAREVFLLGRYQEGIYYVPGDTFFFLATSFRGMDSDKAITVMNRRQVCSFISLARSLREAT